MKDKIMGVLKKYWASLVFGIGGMSLTLDKANFIVLGQAIGIVALILFFISLILDDTKGKGLFPSYSEGELIEICKSNPLASAIVVTIKNILVITVIMLAYFFVKP